MSGAYDAKTISGFARVFTKEELLRNMQRAQDAIAALRDSPSPRTCVELCLVSLCDPALNSGIPELLARISRLEAGTPPPRAPAVEAAPEPEPISVPESEHTYEPAPEDEAPPTPEEPPAYDDGGYVRDEPEPTPEPVGVYYNPEPPMPDRPDNFPEPDPSPAPSGMPKWSEVTAELAKELKPALMRPLTDSGLLTAEFTENSLHLTFSNSFAERRLNTPETMALIRAAASKLAGRPLDIEVTLLGGGKQPTRSVEELRGNPFVKFV